MNTKPEPSLRPIPMPPRVLWREFVALWLPRLMSLAFVVVAFLIGQGLLDSPVIQLQPEADRSGAFAARTDYPSDATARSNDTSLVTAAAIPLSALAPRASRPYGETTP